MRILGPYQDIVELEDIPDSDIKDILAQLIDLMGFEIIREQTPDYTSYELKKVEK